TASITLTVPASWLATNARSPSGVNTSAAGPAPVAMLATTSSDSASITVTPASSPVPWLVTHRYLPPGWRAMRIGAAPASTVATTSQDSVSTTATRSEQHTS